MTLISRKNDPGHITGGVPGGIIKLEGKLPAGLRHLNKNFPRGGSIFN